MKKLTGLAIILSILFLVGGLFAQRGVYTYHISLKGDLVGQNTALRLYPILMKNSAGTTIFRLDSLGNLYFLGTLTSAASVRDTLVFSGAGNRRAKYIAGATATDYYVWTEKSADGTTLPLAGDQVSLLAKTDSLIATRAAGATGKSGLTGYIIRIK